jgi:hypothetical protein
MLFRDRANSVRGGMSPKLMTGEKNPERVT